MKTNLHLSDEDEPFSRQIMRTDVDVHIRLFVEIKAVAQSELLEFCLLTVGLLLGC